MPHLSGPRRYFFHHSNRVLSLQCYPSLAGKTGGTRIDRYRALVMTLVRKCKEQHALAHLYNRLARRLFARRRCGSCSIFEVAHSVYKYALNKHIPWISAPWISERQKTAPQARGRRFCHVFEYTHSVYKSATNEFSFRAQLKNFVIASLHGNLAGA